jgi:hypothetical protein
VTADKLINQCLLQMGLGPAELSEPEITDSLEALNEIVNSTISRTQAGVTDKVVQLSTDQYDYGLDGEVQSVKGAILNDSYAITNSQISIDKLRSD